MVQGVSPRISASMIRDLTVGTWFRVVVPLVTGLGEALVRGNEELPRPTNPLQARIALHLLPGLSKVVGRVGEAFPRSPYALQ